MHLTKKITLMRFYQFKDTRWASLSVDDIDGPGGAGKGNPTTIEFLGD